MKRFASLGAVVGIQAAGSVATLACVLLIARQRGAEIQGSFGLAKAEIDLLVAVLLLGMPQAIFYFLNQGALNWPAVLRLTVVHALFGGLVGIVFMAWRQGPGLSVVEILSIAAVGVAIVALVAQANLRGGLLETRSPVVFSLITAAPGICLLLVVFAVLALGGMRVGGPEAMMPVLATAYALACFVTIMVAYPAWRSSTVVPAAPGIAVLGGYGVATWVPAVAQNLSPVIALTWIDRQIGDSVGVGVFSAAMTSLNLVLTPMAMLIPLLFKRWVGLEQPDRLRDLRGLLRLMAVVCLGFAVLVLLVEKPLVERVFGAEYVTRGMVFALLAVGIWPQAATRLFGVLFSAAGRPWLSIVGESARVCALVIGLFVLDAGDLTTLVCVWVAAEYLSPLASWLLVRRVTTPASGTLA